MIPAMLTGILAESLAGTVPGMVAGMGLVW